MLNASALMKTRVSRTFFAIAFFAIALKLWLVSGIRTLPVVGPHDASNYIEHAKSILLGHWFGSYENLTLIKLPFFPLYIAAVQQLGIPLTLANELFFAFSCVLACIAIRPIVTRGWALGVVFLIVYFNPLSYATLAWIAYRSDVNSSLTLLCFACALALLARRNARPRVIRPWLFGLGFSVAAFWLNREEAVWLIPSLMVIVGAYYWYATHNRKEERAARLSALGIPVFIVVAAVNAIMAINGAVYGWPTAVEQQAPEFVSAYNSLARIVPPTPRFRVPVPRSAREIAYRISPAARELQPSLEGRRGNEWAAGTCALWNVCGDIGGGWFIWAFRDSVAGAGHYVSAPAARAFYVQLAAEIDRACDSGQIACTRKSATLLAPIDPAKFPAIIADAGTVLSTLATFSLFSLDHWPVVRPGPGFYDDYQFVAGSIATDPVTVYNGWFTHGVLKSIGVKDANGAEALATMLFKPSPDVYAALSGDHGSRSGDLSVARFEIATACTANCRLVFINDRNVTSSVPLASTQVNGSDFIYHLDTVALEGSVAADQPLKNGVLTKIEHLYAALLPWLMALAVAIAIARIVRRIRRRSTFTTIPTVLTISATMAVLLLSLILAIVDTFNFPGITVEYFGSVVPLVLFAVAVSVVSEGRLAARYLARRSPRRPLSERLRA